MKASSVNRETVLCPHSPSTDDISSRSRLSRLFNGELATSARDRQPAAPHAPTAASVVTTRATHATLRRRVDGASPGKVVVVGGGGGGAARGRGGRGRRGGVVGEEEAGGAGGDRVRGLDGGHGEQQRDRDGAEEQLPAVRARPAGRRHGPVLQRAAAARLRLRGARPAAARAGLPRPGLRHRELRHRRRLRLRRLRPRQRHRRRPGSDTDVEGGGVLQGVPAASGEARRARPRPAHRGQRGVRRQRGHQRLPGELLPADHRAVRPVHGGRVPGLPGGARRGVPHGHLPPGRAPGHLRGAGRHRLRAAGAHAKPARRRRLQRGVQPGGPGLQREGEGHDREAPGGAPRVQARLHQRLRRHGRPHRAPGEARAGERGRGVLRHGEGRDGVHVQRQGPAHLRRRRQVLLLGLVPPHREGQPLLRQRDDGGELELVDVGDPAGTERMWKGNVL